MRVIIYAKGRVFEKNKEKILWEHVVAIADKTVVSEETICDVPVISPQSIADIQYDYIVIFSNQLFEQIKNELIGEYFVPEEKIISWRGIVEGTEYEIEKKIEYFRTFIQNKQIKRALVATAAAFHKYFSNESGFGCDVNFETEGCSKEAYDVVVSFDDIESFHNILKTNTRYILWYHSYTLTEKSGIEKVQKEVAGNGKLYRFTAAEGVAYLLDRKCQVDEWDEAQIYVVTHKKYNMPNDNLYTPFVVGTKYVQHNYLSEMQGDNIAYLNEKINECTALYWIWKNTTSKYVGLNHYRRKFYNDGNMNSGNYLDAFHVKEILREYDIILTAVHLVNDDTVKTQLENTLKPEVFSKGYDIVRAKLEKYQPEYVEAFDNAMNLRALFVCNMFVTRREILNAYCEWLFSFFIEVAEEMDVSMLDNYNKRVMGFFAERMWTVWLMKKDIKIKELPITEV